MIVAPVTASDIASPQPERYLDDALPSAESAHLPDPADRDHWSFGVGYVAHIQSACTSAPALKLLLTRRRICPGVILAEKEIFLGLAHMLWAFNLEPAPGEPIDLKEYDGVSGRSPVPFRVTLIPRDSSVSEAFVV